MSGENPYQKYDGEVPVVLVRNWKTGEGTVNINLSDYDPGKHGPMLTTPGRQHEEAFQQWHRELAGLGHAPLKDPRRNSAGNLIADYRGVVTDRGSAEK